MTGARPISPAILRVAGWPIETLEPLRSPAFTARVDAWIAENTAIAAMNANLAVRIHAAVPGLSDASIRRAALALKRHLHAGTFPPPDALISPLKEILGSDLDEASLRWESHKAERAAIEAAYDIERARADDALICATDDERFQRALCLASPSIFQQCRRARHADLSVRSRKRFQATLHRYLMRAIGRATPSGLWAGIALEDAEEAPGAGNNPITVFPAASVTRVGPDLRHFVPALLAASLLRLDDVTLHINPTLRDNGDGTWRYGTFVDGIWRELHVDDHAALHVLTARFAVGDQLRLERISAALREQEPALQAEGTREIVAFWVRHGLLWSSISFPVHYADPWQGLDAIVASLPVQEKPSWQACRESLHLQARAIEAEVEQISAAHLRTHLDAAREAVAHLLGRYDLSLADGGDVLVLDRTAPFGFALSDALATEISARLRDYWAFDRHGLGEIETRIGIRETFGDLSRGRSTDLDTLLRSPENTLANQVTATWEDRVLPRATGETLRAAREAFARWGAELDLHFADRIHLLGKCEDRLGAEPLPPGSVMLLVGLKADEAVLRIGGVTPEPGFFHARFAPLFRRADGSRDSFLTWLADGLRSAEQRWPLLRGCELAIRNQCNPNVASRPLLSERRLDPLDTGGRLLRDARFTSGSNGRPILTIEGEDGLHLPTARSAAVLGGLDRCAALLSSITTSLGRPPLLAPMPRLSRESAEWHHLPRLLLGNTAIGPERWTPPDEFGHSLAAAEGAEQFIIWRRYVQSAGLPDLVYSFRGRYHTEALLASDSVLGLALLAQDLKSHGPGLRLQELFPRPEEGAVRDAAGRHYIAELAVAWHADDAFWERYVESAADAVIHEDTREQMRVPEPVS